MDSFTQHEHFVSYYSTRKNNVDIEAARNDVMSTQYSIAVIDRRNTALKKCSVAILAIHTSSLKVFEIMMIQVQRGQRRDKEQPKPDNALSSAEHQLFT
jgi:hypothetical protein